MDQRLDETTFQLETALLRFDAVVRRDLLLPAYSGSTLRGAWGHALRAQTCSTGLADCKTCPVRQNCAYTLIFETLPAAAAPQAQKLSEAPRPYVLHPPGWGERRWQAGEPFTFHQLLIGPAIALAETITEAWQEALSGRIGAGKGAAELLRVSQIGEDGMRMLYGHGIGSFHPARPEPHQALGLPSEFELNFFTPLRLQSQGRPVRLEELSPRRFLSALLRRVRLIAEYHGHGNPVTNDDALFAQLDGIGDTKQLQWQDWQRNSSRQGRAMNLGGYIGQWRWKLATPPDAELSRLLALGQLLHVGKETTFGMGGFSISR